jgi:hypothetical protein
MHTANKFLTLLSPEDIGLFADSLHTVGMAHGQVLAEPHQLIEKMYFPHGGIVSYVRSRTELPGRSSVGAEEARNVSIAL